MGTEVFRANEVLRIGEIDLLRAEAVGTALNLVIGNDDTVVDFEITNNRPDCYSIIGLAREAAAAEEAGAAASDETAADDAAADDASGEDNAADGE